MVCHRCWSGRSKSNNVASIGLEEPFLQRLVTVGNREDVVVFKRQSAGQGMAYPGVVFDDQNSTLVTVSLSS